MWSRTCGGRGCGSAYPSRRPRAIPDALWDQLWDQLSALIRGSFSLRIPLLGQCGTDADVVRARGLVVVDPPCPRGPATADHLSEPTTILRI